MKVTFTAKVDTNYNNPDGYDVLMKEGDTVEEHDISSVEICDEMGETVIDVMTIDGGEFMLPLKNWYMYIQER